MSDDKANPDAQTLPKPITLTAEQIRQIAAGTAALLPVALQRPIIAGGPIVGPVWQF